MKIKINEKYREILMYLIFGVLTTIVSLAVYFLILTFGEKVIGIEADGENPGHYALIFVANVISWVIAVLFAFVTNKKWVFNDNTREKTKVIKQLAAFSGSRLVTLGLDTAITMGTVWVLGVIDYHAFYIWFLECDADFIAKMLASVVVVVMNYVLSKLIVFRKKKNAVSDIETTDNGDEK